VKYSKANERDFKFYFKNRQVFDFCGTLNATHQPIFDINGVDGKEAFFSIENNGKNKPTKHPNLLRALLLSKASVNFNIKMWAEGRADGTLPKIEMPSLQKEFDLPDWVLTAVENQKNQYCKIS